VKLLYVTIKDKTKQGDYLEVISLRALRSVLGDNCIDYPRKNILYGDWGDIDKSSLHGKGFTLFDPPIKDIQDRNYEDVDAIVYGFINKNHYVNDVYPEIEKLNKPIIYIDGHDDSEVVKTPCFKHEVVTPQVGVYPMSLAVPSSCIRPIDLTSKSQLIQTTAPPYSRFGPQILGVQGRELYVFDNEKDYYDDMAKSWFGLSCPKGSWDALRNYEIIAAGALLLFRDFDKKPEFCSPIRVPAVSYSTLDELQTIIERLLPGGSPSEEYKAILTKQRSWLLNNAVDEKLGEYLVSTIKEKILNER